jgi:signal transduction histidine kinase
MRSNQRHAPSAARVGEVAVPLIGPRVAMVRIAVALLTGGALGSAAHRARRRAMLARVAETAAAAERRRVASDLHDGIAQDLALIGAYRDQIAAAMGEGHPVVKAAQRALAHSRATIAELSDPPGESPRQLLGALARDLSDGLGIAVEVDAPRGGRLAPLEGHHLSRIVREAVTNAVRHGHAKTVTVTFTGADGKVGLRIVDDGRPADTTDRVRMVEGFGMRSMRERAAELGGFLEVRRSARGGTELEVTAS